MKINQYQLLHYALIMLLMIVPVRGAVAMQQSHCDMDDNTVYTSADISDHSIAHDMTAMSIADTSVQKADKSHDCCSNNSICISNCDMSMSVSVLMKRSIYTPKFTQAEASVALTTDLITIEHTPPYRPPLVFHS